MSFIDDLGARVEQSFNSVSGDIKSYLENRVTEAVVKAGEPPKGNLTAAQIAQGQAGGPAVKAAGLAKYLPVLAIIGVCYFAFSGKGK